MHHTIKIHMPNVSSSLLYQSFPTFSPADVSRYYLVIGVSQFEMPLLPSPQESATLLGVASIHL